MWLCHTWQAQRERFLSVSLKSVLFFWISERVSIHVPAVRRWIFLRKSAALHFSLLPLPVRLTRASPILNVKVTLPGTQSLSYKATASPLNSTFIGLRVYFFFLPGVLQHVEQENPITQKNQSQQARDVQRGSRGWGWGWGGRRKRGSCLTRKRDRSDRFTALHWHSKCCLLQSCDAYLVSRSVSRFKYDVSPCKIENERKKV